MPVGLDKFIKSQNLSLVHAGSVKWFDEEIQSRLFSETDLGFEGFISVHYTR